MTGRPKIEMTGKRCGRLLVLREAERRPGRSDVYWRCKCDCGAFAEFPGSDLNRGKTVSCGCYQRETASARSTKHGHAKDGRRTPEYEVWKSMIRRCEAPNVPQYKDYGGRGITVCARWREDFSAFYEDMGPRPSKRHQIEREDNMRGYAPGNCVWVLPVINSRNKRRYSNNSTGVNGVMFTPNGKYRAVIGHYGRVISLGTFGTIEEAAIARKHAEAKYWRSPSAQHPSQQIVTRQHVNP